MNWIKSLELIDTDKEYLVMPPPPIDKTFLQATRFGMKVLTGKYIKEQFPPGSFVALEIELPKSLEECR